MYNVISRNSYYVFVVTLTWDTQSILNSTGDPFKYYRYIIGTLIITLIVESI